VTINKFQPTILVRFPWSANVIATAITNVRFQSICIIFLIFFSFPVESFSTTERQPVANRDAGGFTEMGEKIIRVVNEPDQSVFKGVNLLGDSKPFIPTSSNQVADTSADEGLKDFHGGISNVHIYVALFVILVFLGALLRRINDSYSRLADDIKFVYEKLEKLVNKA